MKLWTKVLTLILAAALCICMFVACNGDGETESTPESVTESTPETTPDSDAESEPDTDDWDEYDTITIAEALELCGEDGNLTTERYYIRATVVSIDKAQFGAMTIKDETGEISVYGTYSADGSINYSEMTDKPYKGDEVLLHCTLQNYNGNKEIKNARLIGFRRAEIEIDLTQYTDMSIADARAAAKGTKIKLDGVVAQITYANGMVPSGAFVIDETSSIYVYDRDFAQRVAVGNKVTVAGVKDYWVLDTEQTNAEKFGYKGCNQITEVTLVENDDLTTNEFDKSWITESTIKDILDTPVTEDITTLVYKVTALVKKTPNTGFTNYYFYDLDENTSTYTYTQCNGSDFEWLDKFDGKVCTVYITAINAKSSAAGCLFRFVPIQVIDEDFVFDTTKAAEHALKYYGMEQFFESYSADPALELITSVSSTLLGFENATLTYSSDNESAVYFETIDGKTVMHCGAAGKATVTVTASYNGITASGTVQITVSEAASFDFVNVKTAIDAENGTALVVKGIVGPSLVNQKGFYLIDESGVIAVLTTDDVLATLEIGNEIILSGTRSVKTKGGDAYFGQSHLANGEVLANLYGEHEYADGTFNTEMTVDEFYDLDAKIDYSTTVFVIKATVTFASGGFSSGVSLQGETNAISLYCSGAGQYEFLKQFDGQEVTLEVAACNWNSKNYWRGCVLSVITEDGKVVNTLNFDN